MRALAALFVVLWSAARCGYGQPAPFEYFSNPWTVVGLKDYAGGSRIGPRHDLVLPNGLTARLLLRGGPIPSSIRPVLRIGWQPIVVWRVGAVRVTAFAAPMPGRPFAAYDGPVAGDDYLTVLRVEGRGADRSELLLLRDGRPIGRIAVPSVGAGPAVLDASSSVCVSVARSRTCVAFRIPSERPGDADALLAAGRSDPDAGRVLAATSKWWDLMLARGARIETPERVVADTYRASLAYQWIGRDHGEVHAGEGFYDEVYLRDGSYQLWSLGLAGYLREARESLDAMRRFQKADGQFVSQEGQFDAHGYALWALVEHYRLTGDRAWLRSAYPAIRKAAEWLNARLWDPARSDRAYLGVLPNSPADGENLWAGRNHIVGYDFWCLRGLLEAVDAAGILGETSDAERWAGWARRYRSAIEAHLKQASARGFPPSYEGAGTHWGDLECLFPTLLFPPSDRRVAATIDEVVNRFGGGQVEGCLRWSPGAMSAIHPYLTQFVTNDALVLGDQATALRLFYGMLLHSTSTHGFPEGVHYRTRTAWGDTVPHLWAAALYMITLRNMLVREQGDELHLSSAVPDHWLAPGRTVQAIGLPTRFGSVSVTWRAEAGRILLRIQSRHRNAPRRIVIHLPRRIRPVRAIADGRPAQVRDGLVVVPADAATVAIRVRRRAGPRDPSFASTVAEYEKHRPAPHPAPKSLVRLPLPGRIPPGDCTFVDLRAAATTDPFRSPFRVPVSGSFTFETMPTGLATAAGVPFRIVDPSQNSGRGLVVLNGADACRDLPSSARFEVGVRGRIAVFLGNVTGWGPDDPGAGAAGAVAEYVLRYADGVTERIPLVSGVTVDDWRSPPAATASAVGLRGPAWHLNVIAVRLRPVVLRSIEFRDAGTPASPLLAAVTVVR